MKCMTTFRLALVKQCTHIQMVIVAQLSLIVYNRVIFKY